MLNVKVYKPRLVHYIPYGDLPDYLQDIVLKTSCDDCYRLVDCYDGDYYWTFNLNINKYEPESEPYELCLYLNEHLSLDVLTTNLFGIYVSQ